MNKTFDLERLLPHRAPMILLSRALDYNEHGATAQVSIDQHSPFFDAQLGGVPAWIGMEYMAQTIGIWAGNQQLSRNKPVQPGFLLGCRSYRSNCAYFPTGCTLDVSAAVIYVDDNHLGVFDCTISTADILATAQIKAFRPENPQQFVRTPPHPLSTGLNA
ncbi:MAG: hypothetical protein IT470_03815 [Pseudomonadales bacterium]|nr:hypothetical protein [Pseudomonadales bacterium]